MTDYRGEFSRPNKNGEYTYNKLQENIDCYSNSPNNVTSNTPTIIHTYGAKIDEVWYDSQEAALNRDATCIFPARMSDPIDVFENIYREVWNQNDKPENIILTGHSAGGPTALKALATMYQEGNINTSPPMVVMLDGSFKTCKLTPEEIKTLADNKVPIIAYYQLDKQKSYYEMLGENGVNIAMIRDNDCHDHGTPCTNFFENEKGLYDFVCGKGILMTGVNGYNVSVWSNGEEKYTNNGNPHNISGINTIDKVYAMFNIDTYSTKINKLKLLNKASVVGLTFSIDNHELDQNLRNVITNIGNTSYVVNNFDISCDGSSLTLSKVASLTKNYFSITTDLLLNIANEMKEFTKIGPAISSVEKVIEKEATELNNTNLVNTLSTNIVTTATTMNASKSVTTTNSNTQQSTVTPVVDNSVTPTNNKNSSSNKQDTQQINNVNSSKPTINQSQITNKESNTNTDISNQFPEYTELYSDESKIVYNYNDEYRIIVHKDGEKITGIEHYYKFDSLGEADSALESLKLEYSNNQNIQALVQKGQYIKVLFNENIYKNLTITDIRQQYSQLNEIIKL